MQYSFNNPQCFTNNAALVIDKGVFQIQELERIKLGHELHDDVNPTLAVAKLYLQLATERPAEGKEIMKRALFAIMSAMESIRKISSEMVVSQRKDFNLISLTNDFIKKINEMDLFKISFTCPRSIRRMTNDQQICLYRVIQEQTNNIIKYSKAKNVQIILACKKNIWTLVIKDNGVGFDTNIKPKGIGLMNIANRVEGLNGKSGIHSEPGKGCLLQIELPVL